MSRYEFGGLSDQRKAALQRQTDARMLKENRRWRGAMYLLGYAVECRLKERLMEVYGAKSLEEAEREIGKRQGERVRLTEHRIEYMFRFLGIGNRLAEGGDKADLRAFQRCNGWSVNWRYNPDGGDEEECADFFSAAERFMRFLSVNS